MRYLAPTHPIDLVGDKCFMELLAIERICCALAVTYTEVSGIFWVLSTFWNQVTSLDFYIRIFKRTLAPWLCQVRARICYSFLSSFEDPFIFFFSSFAFLSFWWDQPVAAKPSQDKRCKIHLPLVQLCFSVLLFPGSFISLFIFAHVQQSYLSLHVHKTLNAPLKLPSIVI